MTENDNLLIERLFQQASQQQIADGGFSERVMASLPDGRMSRQHRLSLLWTCFCVVVGAVLFVAFNGWQALKASMLSIFDTMLTWLSVFLTTASTADVHIDPWMLLLALAFVFVVLPYQTARRLSASL